MKIQRLNMDNSWFIEFGGLRMLIDPWLFGEEVDFFPWFNTQWHKTKPLEVEKLPSFDVVVVTQKYPDHFHLETLNRIKPKIIIGPKSIQKQVTSKLPEATFYSFNDGLTGVLSSQLNIHHLPTTRLIDPIYDALILEDGTSSICIASHGYPDILKKKAMWENLPPVELLISPFDHYELPIFLGGTVAPGIDGLIHLSEALQPKKIVATHDEDKHAKGMVIKFARITKAPSIASLEKHPIFQGKILDINNYNIHTL
jgi:L-ascorbate metabolism protein UlaG (beta-lactamase superfamily)